jgi:hypothetical protein
MGPRRKFTSYLVHSKSIPNSMYRLREFQRMPTDGKYPSNTPVIVDRLVNEKLMIEVQAIAAL